MRKITLYTPLGDSEGTLTIVEDPGGDAMNKDKLELALNGVLSCGRDKMPPITIDVGANSWMLTARIDAVILGLIEEGWPLDEGTN